MVVPVAGKTNLDEYFANEINLLIINKKAIKKLLFDSLKLWIKNEL